MSASRSWQRPREIEAGSRNGRKQERVMAQCTKCRKPYSGLGLMNSHEFVQARYMPTESALPSCERSEQFFAKGLDLSANTNKFYPDPENIGIQRTASNTLKIVSIVQQVEIMTLLPYCLDYP
ncbi:hypothetical protein FB451DRAFT_1171894 [Mycena latifolia]|nr:hypothetical protein FB451DRAFT_1171894 [Mycena latifolia]